MAMARTLLETLIQKLHAATSTAMQKRRLLPSSGQILAASGNR